MHCFELGAWDRQRDRQADRPTDERMDERIAASLNAPNIPYGGGINRIKNV